MLLLLTSPLTMIFSDLSTGAGPLDAATGAEDAAAGPVGAAFGALALGPVVGFLTALARRF